MAFGKENPDYFLRKLGDWAAEGEEVTKNPRARSARLRAAEKVVDDGA
jgi:16S rRNA C1402 N4-methylase RsmH